MRLSPGTGKQDCHIIDFVDSMKRVIGVVSVPTLLGLDPTTVVDGITHSLIWLSEMLMPSCSEGTITELELRADAATGDSSVTPIGDNRCSIPDPRSVTYIDYDDPFSLVNQSLGTSPHITQLSRNAWVGCGDDIYVLECLGKGHIRIEPVPDGERDLRKESPFIFSFPPDKEKHFHAHYTSTIHPETATALNISRFRTNRKILDASCLADAVRGCDTYATEKILKGPLSQA
jgi:ATP-dependent helicase IRC3